MATSKKIVKENKDSKYKMSLSLNVLSHLGMNLYSNIPSVLSEVVANAYDADAKKVTIDISEDTIIISDDGHGMDLDDINSKFLCVGYQRRENGEAFSQTLKRPVMGRKGIGKLSLFSIADNIEIHTTRKVNGKLQKNGFVLNKNEILKQIKDKNGIYNPQEIIPENINRRTAGTTLIITQFKKNVNQTEGFLKRRLARRFSIIGKQHDFIIEVNGEPITVEDRDFFKKLQMIWFIGDDEQKLADKFSFQKVNSLNGKIDGSDFSIHGWIGTVQHAGDLKQDDVNNNKISIVCRGKLAQEDILESYNEGGIYATYLIGEIHADFLDTDDAPDIATSSRQSINEDDSRYVELTRYIHSILKQVQKVWTDLRLELAEKNALEQAEKDSPVLKEWFDTLTNEASQKQAKKLFATIQTLHFDKGEDKETKKELYKQGILAFEKLKLKNELDKLDKITSVDDIRLSGIFTGLFDIEANLYYDIATQRIRVIQEFKRHLDENDKETLLQKYLFDNLWLLNPSWERATEGTGLIESKIKDEFEEMSKSLTQEERLGRRDIKYRTAAGKHIIIELKRYHPTYPLDQFILGQQAKKYKDTLEKCLRTVAGRENESIEIIIVLGRELTGSKKEVDDVLKVFNARVIYYDHLIEQSLQSYSHYIDKHREIGKIRNLIDNL